MSENQNHALLNTCPATFEDVAVSLAMSVLAPAEDRHALNLIEAFSRTVDRAYRSPRLGAFPGGRTVTMIVGAEWFAQDTHISMDFTVDGLPVHDDHPLLLHASNGEPLIKVWEDDHGVDFSVTMLQQRDGCVFSHQVRFSGKPASKFPDFHVTISCGELNVVDASIPPEGHQSDAELPRLGI